MPAKRLEVAVQAAGRLTKEEFALVTELLRLDTDEVGIERRRAMAEGLREAIRQYLSQPPADPLADVDAPIAPREAVAATVWADLEARTNRLRLLRDCVSAEEAGRLTGRSRQAIERQRRAGRMVALRVGRRWRYPVWQLDADASGGVVLGLAEVLEHLRLSPAGAAWWLTAPASELDGRAPIQLLRNHESDRVVHLAAQQGYLP
ncbi:MAG: helix-turn-helix domain-containing protein [bacterium]|nr:helix-turn-helix domain-containing protein [bacterium]